MDIYIPIIIMLLSLILIGISVFLLYYYDSPTYALVIFIIGIILGIISCLLFIYLRTPGVINKAKDEIDEINEKDETIEDNVYNEYNIYDYEYDKYVI